MNVAADSQTENSNRVGVRITDIATSDRSSEKMQTLGLRSMVKSELFAILLSVGWVGEEVPRMVHKICVAGRAWTGL